MSLIIEIPGSELWDSEAERFIHTEPRTLVLNHSLVSLSKWEARFEKPFLSNEKKTAEETYAYIQIMSETPISLDDLKALNNEAVQEINSYIEAKHSATWFVDMPNAPKSREIITAEIIYYWMTALSMPLEMETWHLNRLFTQIKVINEKNKPKKKMSRASQIAEQRRLNAERLAASGGRG